KDLVLLKDAQCEGIHQRVLRVAARENNFAANRRNSETVSVRSDAGNHALNNMFGFRVLWRPEPEAVHRGYRPRAHREDIAEDAANTGRGPLKRLNIRRMVVRFDLKRNRQAFADIDDAGILARSLQNGRPFGRQTAQMNPGTLVRAVFAPHHAE